MGVKLRFLNRNGRTVIEVEGGEVKIVKREGNAQNLPALSSRQALPVSSSNPVEYSEKVNDSPFSLDDAERALMRGEEPEGFLDWFIQLLFGHAESKIERIERITKELEGRHQLREQIIKLTAQKYRMAEALIEGQYSVVIKRLTCEAEAQRLKALKAVYETEEGKAKRALKREQGTNALTEGRNEHDYDIKSFFDLIEDDASNYLKPKR